MRFLKPDYCCRFLTDVTPAAVRALGCEAVLIDADNTSSYDLTTDPLPGTEEWILRMKEAGLPVLLLSNAKAERAAHLADRYDIPVIGLAAKPFPFGYLRAAVKLRKPPRRLVMLGDQLFTDILGANLTGCKSILVEPYGPEDGRGVLHHLKRAVERNVSRNW